MKTRQAISGTPTSFSTLVYGLWLRVEGLPPKDAASHLGNAGLLCELCILLPNLVVLRDGQRAQRTIVCLARPVHQLLSPQKFRVLGSDDVHGKRQKWELVMLRCECLGSWVC